ncbi:DUF3106 domain-containing protein [Thiothrix subterranea]|uniref:DUF3106 domain-containing protein n=1 Tax=Thiothrix subterranea TaxID=2735563 RepID=A0AA51QXJ4_9GAMM|nr:DUF3106 domain-containing protein [Thiothrix subterranea]MDQ5769839.1 DUF3106 domain-containing protein [Thiothrix subterranea]WML84952.1 DUF3106 domain-containing protein [Thiothrix subterranea]
MTNSSNKRRFVGFFMALLTMMALLLAGGNAMAGSVTWESLSDNEKSVLKAFQSDWSSLSDKTQGNLKRWAAKPATERSRIKQRFGDWQQLSAAQQKKIAKQLKRYKAMSPAQKAKIKQWHEWVKKLPENERKQLREKWPSMTDVERRAYMKDLQQQYGK